MDRNIITPILQNEGLINHQNVIFEPLRGGVSSDIYKISDGVNTYVIKRALPKLQVRDDWYADVSRNQNEQNFIHFLQHHNPDAVTKILYSNSDHQFFVMEYLNDSFKNWKEQLLDGRFDTSTAKIAADLLAEIHNQSRHDKELKHTFNNSTNFYNLRIEPYLITTGKRHPLLKDMFFDEAKRLKDFGEAVIHGDFSPKNIMTNKERVVILDHEVAWFGDPAFDLAFLLNHLYLKMLVHFEAKKEIQDLTEVVWNRYFENSARGKQVQMETRTGRLLLMLMLARMDGKSPVEYLQKQEKEFTRSFVYELLPKRKFAQSSINTIWKSKLKKYTF